MSNYKIRPILVFSIALVMLISFFTLATPLKAEAARVNTHAEDNAKDLAERAKQIVDESVWSINDDDIIWVPNYICLTDNSSGLMIATYYNPDKES